jgi:hypothetical protein
MFYYLVGVGRRVQIVNHVSWNPLIAFVGHTSSTKSDGFRESSATQLEVIPLQFLFLF